MAASGTGRSTTAASRIPSSIPPRERAGPCLTSKNWPPQLKAASNGAIDADARHLLLSDISLSDADHVATLTAHGSVYRCTLGEAGACTPLLPAQDKKPADKQAGSETAATHPPLALSPDKKLGAFIRDWNLWVRDLATGAETQLTTDGVKDYGYATDNAGWKSSDRPFCSGRRIRRRLPPSSRISATPARCTWSP